MNFEHSQLAIAFAERHHLHGVQILVKFVEDKFDSAAQLPTHQPAETSRRG